MAGVRAGSHGRSHAAPAPDSGGDSRAGLDDLRQSLGADLEREPDSPLLVRASLEALLGACVERAQQIRGAVGLVAFELEDWKSLHESAGASAFTSAFADLALELRRRVRASDEIGRLGEAQMAAILPGCEPDAISSVAERLRRSLEARELSLAGQPLRPTVATAWISAAPRSAPTDPARLLEEIASALERARTDEPG